MAAGKDVDVESGVPRAILNSPLHVRVSLFPELAKGYYGDGFLESTPIDAPPWPVDQAWAETERMLNVTMVMCGLALSAAWCLLLLTALSGALSGVLGFRNNL